MTLLDDLEEYVSTHGPHGGLEGTTGELTPNGYRLAVTCACRVTFERWITPEEAAGDLAVLARWN